MSFDRVAIENLPRRLGAAENLDPPSWFRSKPLHKWRMETDDSVILRYIFRTLRPGRHLEFGTWLGDGTMCALEECDASVWTINLPWGERKADGRTAYHSRRPPSQRLLRALLGPRTGHVAYQSDTLEYVGSRYLKAGLGHRVCQIYCDSRDWDISQYPGSFFDSVLVDGGHSPAVVVSDTDKGLALLRSGGIVMWHDFAPDPEVRTRWESVQGVTTALEAEEAALRKQLADVFWVDPSWLLIGIKN